MDYVKDGLEAGSKFCDSTVGKAVLGGTAALGATSIAVPVVLGAVGFGSGGVGVGTLAAGLQSYIGNVAPGSLFALCQSVGTTGAVGCGCPSMTLAGVPYLRRPCIWIRDGKVYLMSKL